MPESLFFFLQYAYTEEYEQQRGKGSFPAHLTPGYKMSKKASEQASDVSRQYKKTTHMHTITVADPRSSVGNGSHALTDKVSSDV